MKTYKAIYKCRMCGEVYAAAVVADKDIADKCMTELVTGIRGIVPGAPTITDTHYCGGDHAGSMGLADFQGMQKEADT